MKGSVASAAVLLLVGAASAPIAAQDYPSRPVRAITAFFRQWGRYGTYVSVATPPRSESP